MKGLKFINSALVILFGIIFWQSYSKPFVFTQKAIANDIQAKVIDLQGEVYVNRNQNSESPTSLLEIGSLLNSKDTIIKPTESKITVLCNGKTLWHVTEENSIVGDNCPERNNRSNDTLTNRERPDSSRYNRGLELLQKQPVSESAR